MSWLGPRKRRGWPAVDALLIVAVVAFFVAIPIALCLRAVIA